MPHERLKRAESAPTRVASGRIGVRAKPAIALTARNRLHHPKWKFLQTCRSAAVDPVQQSKKATSLP